MKKNPRIAIAQINSIVGDIETNATRIITYAILARDYFGADLVIFPEMILTGYPPEDLLLRPELYSRLELALKRILTKIKNIYVVIGLPTRGKTADYNSAMLIYNGKIRAQYHKQNLPNYGVFDEKRYFAAGTKACTFNISGTKIALTICEDLWFKKSMQAAKNSGAKLMISINASPFDIHKAQLREKVMGCRAREGKMPIIYVNAVGGQDELVFDGGSLVLNASGKVIQRANFFTESLMPVDLATKSKPIPIANIEERAYQALVLGVRDYIEKNNFKGAIIGSSGGIDSALTTAIAVDALGKNRVETVYMPSRYSSDLSTTIATELAALLNIKHHTVLIEPILKSYLKALPVEFSKSAKDTTKENLQARIRGTLLMAFSNKKGLMVLSTGNKSEMAVGYATLYGDMAGGYCVLKDVPKTLVYRLAKYRNSLSHVIPDQAITREPSAELALNQKDIDTLPPYSILDEIIERYIELDQSRETIIKAGFAPRTVKKVINMINRNEYKRRQAPPGIRITARAFGRDRRYPITSGF